MKKLYIIDRFEENYAVLEDENKSFINIEVEVLPTDVKEYDVLSFDGKSYYIDEVVTTNRKEYISDLEDELFT